MTLEVGDVVDVADSYEGGKTVGYRGTIVQVFRSGSLVVDDLEATDGAGNPIRHIVAKAGAVTKVE